MNKPFYLMGGIAAIVLALILIFSHKEASDAPEVNNQNHGIITQIPQGTPPPVVAPNPPPPPAVTAKIFEPVNNALSRITKKHFGTKVSPTNSPVSPEKFTGYHTGVDFETTAEEADVEVPVSAICDGKLLQKRTASGYGGIAVQACAINGMAVTVVYGHLKLSSITAAVNSELKAGNLIGILGKGYSTETDGERKHLHLGIHKGTAVNIAGYVSASSQLTSWLDAEALLK